MVVTRLHTVKVYILFNRHCCTYVLKNLTIIYTLLVTFIHDIMLQNFHSIPFNYAFEPHLKNSQYQTLVAQRDSEFEISQPAN